MEYNIHKYEMIVVHLKLIYCKSAKRQEKKKESNALGATPQVFLYMNEETVSMINEIKFLPFLLLFICSVWKSNFCLSFKIVTDFLGVINTSTIYKIRKSFLVSCISSAEESEQSDNPSGGKQCCLRKESVNTAGQISISK